jgi:competence protein ComEA
MKRKKIKATWLDYFNFSSRERKGAFFLSMILIVQIGVLAYLRNYKTKIIPPDERLVSSLLSYINSKKNDSLKIIQPESLPASIKIHPFDPNKLSLESAITTGLTERQAKVILNYLSKGGVFRTKKDFRKMYCISQNQFQLIEPFLLLPDSFQKTNLRENDVKKTETKSQLVDISTADSIMLMKIKGIGPVFASRILKYRDKLGGFYSKSQLLEVWGIKDSLYNIISPSIILSDTIPYRFVHLNTDSFQALAAHPYIRYKLSSIICSFRKQHQRFSSIAELKSLPLVTEENFRKLAPYLQPD